MKQFGTTINETVNSFKGHLGEKGSSNRTQAIARIIISVILLSFAIILILKDDSSDIGEVIIGAITGYWLK